MLRRLVLALLATAALPAPRPLVAQSTSSATALRYQFTMSTAEEKTSRGTVTVLGDRARIDVEKGSSARVASGGAKVTASSDGGHDWFLLTEGGKRIAIVDSDKQSYAEMDAATFTGLIGTVMRAVDAFMTMEVEQPTVFVQRLGDGGTIAGKRTERWAVVQEFTTNVGIMGKTQREMHRVVTDYWIAPGLELPENPLWELVTRGETALAQADKKYVASVARARGSLPEGAALRVVITSASSELPNGTVKAPKVQRLEVTDISSVTVSRSLLEIPRGYEKKDAGKGFSIDF